MGKFKILTTSPKPDSLNTTRKIDPPPLSIERNFAQDQGNRDRRDVPRAGVSLRKIAGHLGVQYASEPKTQENGANKSMIFDCKT
jgi:hypothetical protein